MFTSKYVYNSLVQIKHFTAPQKLFNTFIFKMCKMAVAGQNTQRQSKPILVIISIKPFTCQTELQTKWFFTQNWVGGFYGDRLFERQVYFINATRISCVSIDFCMAQYILGSGSYHLFGNSQAYSSVNFTCTPFLSVVSRSLFKLWSASVKRLTFNDAVMYYTTFAGKTFEKVMRKTKDQTRQTTKKITI